MAVLGAVAVAMLARRLRAVLAVAVAVGRRGDARPPLSFVAAVLGVCRSAERERCRNCEEERDPEERRVGKECRL